MLHNHSNFSRLDGLSTCKEIAERVKEIGFEGCAITDHDIVTGHVDFYKTMTSEGLKPVLGVETYQAYNRKIKEKKQKDSIGCRVDNFHLLLLAQNNTGLQNLWRLNTESHRCVTPEMRILTSDLRWIEAGSLKVGDSLVSFDDIPNKENKKGKIDGNRKISKSIVEYAKPLYQNVYRIILKDGTELRSSAEHPWLICNKNGRIKWMQTEEIFAQFKKYKGNLWGHRRTPPRFVRYFNPWESDLNRAAGYVAGILDGEGSFGYYPSSQTQKLQISQNRNLVLREIENILNSWEVPYSIHDKNGGYGSNCMELDILGGRSNQWSLLGRTQPPRLLEKFNNLLDNKELGTIQRIQSVEIEDISYQGNQIVIGLQTSTGTYFSEGFGSHNSGFYYHGRVDWELLEKFNEGLICTSACASSMLGQLILHERDYEEALSNYLRIFGDRFYLEIGTYSERFQLDLNETLVTLANDWSIPMTYGNDAHYAYPYQYDLHEATLAVQFNDKLPERTDFYHSPCLFIMSEKEIKNDYLFYLDQVDEIFDNSKKIIDSCNVTLPTYRLRTPVFIPSKETNSWDEFFGLVENGFKDKVISKNLDQKIYMNRLTREMEVFQEASLWDYFLIVRDYIKWAKDNKIIVGPGRGSAAGSLVAYLLDITEVDPIKYDLIFERFYNIGRGKSMPDIDTDFSTKGKDLVSEYISNKYGKDRVAHLGTVITLKGKGAINDLGRAMGIPIEDTKAITKIIDQTIEAGIQSDWIGIKKKVGPQLDPYMRLHPQLFEWAERLYEHVRAYGVHASGVIIGDESLDGTFPLRWSTKEEKLVTQWPMETAEEFGFMKNDLLGLRNLDTLEEVNRILKETGKKPIDYQAIDDENMPEEMWEMLDKGLTTGLFQIEEGIMAKNITQKMKPRSINDLAVLLALNRPGPLESGDVGKYIAMRQDLEKNKIIEAQLDNNLTFNPPDQVSNSIIDECTKDTFGVFVFQEQIIKLLTSIGYTLEEADNFRAIMGKKKVKEIKAQYKPFMTKLMVHMDQSQADATWKKIENFSKYGFGKAHAICYATILFRTLYTKFFYPSVFTLACIRTVDKTVLPLYFNEAKRLQINIYPPDVNKSEVETVLDGESIRFGLGDIKYVGKSTARWIVKNVPFESKEDLLEKSKLDEYKITLPNGIRRVGINSKQAEILEKIGAFGEFVIEDESEQIEVEKQYLGFSFSDKSAMIIEEYMNNHQEITPINALEEDGNYIIVGTVDEFEHRKTKSGANIGSPYARVMIRDNTGSIGIFVWSSHVAKIETMWRRNLIGEFRIKKNPRGISLVTSRTI